MKKYTNHTLIYFITYILRVVSSVDSLVNLPPMTVVIGIWGFIVSLGNSPVHRIQSKSFIFESLHFESCSTLCLPGARVSTYSETSGVPISTLRHVSVGVIGVAWYGPSLTRVRNPSLQWVSSRNAPTLPSPRSSSSVRRTEGRTRRRRSSETTILLRFIYHTPTLQRKTVARLVKESTSSLRGLTFHFRNV